jgi:hypothetical protein
VVAAAVQSIASAANSGTGTSGGIHRRLVTTPLPPAVAVVLQERAVEAFQEFVAALAEQR